MIRRFFAVWLLCLSGAAVAGPLERVPNASLQMPPSPPTFGFTSTNAFPGLIFTNPVVIATPPGETNRLFIVDKDGVIQVITNLAAPNQTVFMDIRDRVTSTDANSGTAGEQGLLGLAFHPGYATNRYFYVFYTGNATTSAGTGRHDILSRFETFSGNPNQGDSGSELRLIAQLDQQANHNGGDIQFGPDGYLYVPLGDEGGGNDDQQNSQRITKDFFAAILRLDVDKKPGNLVPNPHASVIAPTNYLVPADNPFIGWTTFNGAPVSSNAIRTEFWAVGLRNPWRMTFDPLNGTLYCADVGQAQREEVNVITRGRNYGWSYWEGFLQRTNPTPFGFTNTLPIVDYAHTGGRVCIIGGVVYRGGNLSQLYGAYVYAEYATGEIWMLKHTGTNVTENPIILTDTGSRLVTFGTDPRNGDVLYAAHLTTGHATNSIIKRIIYNNATNGAPLPPTLADTGAFTNLTSLTPHAGIVPYEINVPFWSDNAIKSRWFSVPKTNLTIDFQPAANWTFPTGTVWVKHFDLELTNGVSASRKRLETRLLVKNTNGVYGVTYRWGDSLTNAALVAEGGMDESFLIYDGGGALLRTQVWHYPSRTECVVCHTPEAGFALGFNTPQINRDYDYGGTITNQLHALSDAGYFSASVSSVEGLLALAHATNENASLEHRVRSYLSANCVQCHQPGGAALLANWDARIHTSMALAGIVNGPLASNLGDTNNRVVVPLTHSNSVLLSRISVRGVGTGQMPPLATSLVDTQNVALVTEWISTLTNLFWTGISPDARTVVRGQSTNFTVTVLATPDFIDPVTLSVSGLPPNTSAQFAQSVLTGSTNTTLTLQTSNNTPFGTFTLTITGTSGAQTNSDVATFTVSGVFPRTSGALIWNGSEGDTNWSTSLNWSNATIGFFGPPSPSNNLVFNNTGAAGAPGEVNSIVDTNLAGANTRINGLAYTNSIGFHTTLIPAGRTLFISNNAPGNTLFAGTGVDSGSNQTVHATITGGGGTLVVSNSVGNISVRQGGSPGTHQATLDLSGLGTFSATVSRVLVAGDGGANAGDRRLAAVLYLARTNLLNLTGASPSAPAITLGDHPSEGRGNPPIELLPSYLYLGRTNAIFANTITVGRQKAAPVSMLFNPAFLGDNPAVYIRGTAGTNSRLLVWTIGDNAAQTTSNQASEGTNDFTGGTIDALVTTLYVGRGESSPGNAAGSGTGTLTFDQGTIDVNTMEIGLQTSVGNNSAGIGTVNVNGGTLIVNTSLRIANYNSGSGISQGTLNINSGTVRVNTLTAGGGQSAIQLSNGGLLIATNTIGTPAAPFTTLALTNASLRFNLSSSFFTNVNAGTLSLGGVNTLLVQQVPTNLVITTVYPLIAYTNLIGSVANLTAGPMPPNYSAYLVDNAARKTIDLVITHGPSAPMISAFSLNGSSIVFSGSNGSPNWTYYLLSSTNLSLPLTSWTALATSLFDSAGSFQLTNSADPNAPQQFYLLQLP